MTRQITTAVILAAGSGSRIGELGRYVPKPLLPILNEPLICRNLRWLSTLGITHAEIVIGHLGDDVRRAVEANPIPGLTVRFTGQSERLGIAHAVGQLDGIVREPFLLLLGDYVFEAPELKQMLVMDDDTGCLLSAKEESDREALSRNFSIEHDKNGIVRRVREKPKDPPNNLKGCGIYSFDPRVFDAIRRTPRSAMRNEYEITDTIQILIDSGVTTRFLPIVTWDINMTYPADLLASNLHFLSKERHDRKNIVMSALPLGSIVRRSVIGRSVKIASPVRLRDSIVFDGAELGEAMTLTRSVVYGSHVFAC